MKDERLRLVRDNLQEFTSKCRDDMHEPDEQGITARVVGTTLNNAFGNSIDSNRLLTGGQEIVVILQKKHPYCLHTINLADLIALARQADV